MNLVKGELVEVKEKDENGACDIFRMIATC